MAATAATAVTKGVAVEGVAAEERGRRRRRAAGGRGWLDIGKGVGKPASAGGLGSAVSVGGVGVEGVGGGMAGGVLAAVAGRRLRR